MLKAPIFAAFKSDLSESINSQSRFFAKLSLSTIIIFLTRSVVDEPTKDISISSNSLFIISDKSSPNLGSKYNSFRSVSFLS